MKIRGVPEEIIFEVLGTPNKIDFENEGQLIYQNLFYLMD